MITNENEELKTVIKPLYAYIRKHSDKIDTIAVSVDNAAWVTFADTTQRKLLVEPIESAPTNGDRWRAMTDEQIAEIIQHDGCCACPVDEYIYGQETTGSMCEEEFNRKCKAAIVKWLKEEAKENG